MALQLSEGAIAAIMQGENSVKPILQLITIRPISSGSGPPRYRLLMSDGVNTLSSCMLATQLNSMIDDKSLTANAICQINRFIVNTLKDGRRVMIIMDLTVLRAGDANTPKIGNPVQYVEGAGQGVKPLQSPGLASNQAPSQPPQHQNSSTGAGVSSPSGKVTSFSGSPKVPGKGPSSYLINTPGGSQTKVVPIASLNPYQSRWTICARVTQKGQIRTWSNSRGEGKLFSIELVDESGEIRATAFNDEVDKFYPLIELDKVYYFSKAYLKTAKKQYTAVKNDYEIAFAHDTSVIPCEHPQHFPNVQFNFVSISDLESVSKDCIVDIIGICKSYEDATKITIRSSNREVFKRDINLIDMSGKTVTVTLWGTEAEKFDGSQQPVVAIKGARVSDFGGRSLSVITSSTIIINPDRPESFKLRGWFDSEGQLLEAPSISSGRTGPTGDGSANWKTLREVKTENLGKGDKADYYSCVGTVIYLWKEKCMYQACPSPNCNKKVIDEQNGLYRCEKCDKEFPNFEYRMILPVNIVDFQDNQWITCFQEAAETILGKNAAYLGELKEKNEQAFVEVLEKSLFTTFEFRVRIKLETFNDEPRMKATALDVRPVNHKEHSKRLILKIRRNAQLLG